MRFCAYHEYDAVATGLAQGDRVVSLDDLNDAMGADFGPDLDALLKRGQADAFAKAVQSGRVPTSGWRVENLRFAAPLAHPSKIWGVGLNFLEHAKDLGAAAPEDPAAWMRPATTLTHHGATVRLPPGVGRVTAEAEIGVVLGKYARDLASREAARDAVFGFVPIL